MESNHNLMVAPGEVIAEIIEARKWTIAELSDKSGIDESVINGILAGSEPLTVINAAKLGNVVQISTRLLLEMESSYRKKRGAENG